jgi:PKD repeat protein
LAISLGNGNDGEIISYNWDDGNFYHWSGNGTVVMEKFPATAPYTPVTNIVTTGLTGGETFGALYLGGGNFLMSNIASHFKYANAVGTYGNDLINLPDDLRGIVLPPNYEISDDTVCVNDIVTYGMVGIARDTAVYFWGDGSSSTVFPAGPASHSYTTAGNYTAYAVLKNDTVGNDTMASTAMVVRALPAVALVPGTDTIMCFADTLDLIGASGGTLQWYMNGSAIVGANSASYQVTANGHYNMTKTNLNGCTDSAAVGVMVVFGNQPTADLGADSTVCEGDTICYALSNPADVSYLWSDGNTSASDCFIASAAGTTAISVRATDSAGCIASDTTHLTVIGFPNPSVSVDTSNCPTIVFTVSDPNGAAWVWNFGDGSPTASGMTVSHTYLVNNSYSPQVTASNQCFSVVDSGALLIQCIVGVDNALAHAIHIAPNPSNGQFVLQAALPAATSFSYRITDLQGREHLAKSYDDARSNWSEKIDFHGASGIYFLNVTAGDQRIAYRLVIQ